MLLGAGLVFGGALFSQAVKESRFGDRDNNRTEAQGDGKKPVDIKAERSNYDSEVNKRHGIEENAVILVGDVAFHHNGAVITCDSAIRYSDRRIDCFKNVIINQDSTYVYGDRAEYNGDLNLARVYSPVVKVIDGDATLYTYNFSFNTATKVGTWFGGGVMYQQDNTMESEKGYFYSDDHELVAVRNVEMRNDSHWIATDSVRYNTETEIATFYTRTYIWTNDGEMIRADKGRYHTRDSTYFFWDNAYVMDEFRETWADTIDFRARTEDIFMYGNIQIDDNEHESSAFGDFGRYWGERGETMLTKTPSLLNYNAEEGNSDTLYMRADTVFMFVVYPSDGRTRDSVVAPALDPHAHLRWVDSLPDSVRLVMADSLAPVIARLRASQDSLKRRADSIMDALYPPLFSEGFEGTGDSPGAADSLGMADSLAAGHGVLIDSLAADALAGAGLRDSLAGADSLALNAADTADSLGGADSLRAADTKESKRAARRSRRGNRDSGPNQGAWHYPDALSYFGHAADFAGAGGFDNYSHHAAYSYFSNSTTADSLSGSALRSDRLRDSLADPVADSLTRTAIDSLMDAQLLLDTLLVDEPAPLVPDTLIVAAPEPIVSDPAAPEQITTPGPAPEAESAVESEPTPEPERPEPPEVVELRARMEAIKAEADSLQTAETYIRPRPAASSDAGTNAADSLARMRTDSLARVDSLARMDSLSVADPVAFGKLQKAEAKRLKTEAKAARRAEKQRLREEKYAKRDSLATAKAIARRLRAATKRGIAVDSLGYPIDSVALARADSLARRDSMLLRDSLHLRDSLKIRDSLALHDTLPAAEADTTMRIFRGWHNVKIWRKDMQAVCDSMVGFSADSTVRMYVDPILWYGDSQITADSITLITANEQIERAEFYGEPIMGSQVAGRQFNQIKGQTMTSFFRDSEIYRHDTDGAAQTLYYIQEEEKGPDGEVTYTEPVGFLIMTSTNISFLISDQYVDYIIPREGVDWTIYPMDQIPPTQQTRLQGFEWRIELKPALIDVFSRTVRPAERTAHEAMSLPAFPIAARIDRRREYLIKNRMWGDRVDPLPAHAVEWARTLQN
jgi:hypothetical protein